MKKKKADKTLVFAAMFLITILLFKFIPKNKIREAHVAFLFKQIITWLLGLFVVEKNLISYPTRLFYPKANNTSFAFEFYIYPAISALFNVHYPEKRDKIIRFLYYFFYTFIITIFEVLAVKYTGIIHYKKWKWYWSFISIWFTFYVSHLYFKWFFNGTSVNE